MSHATKSAVSTLETVESLIRRPKCYHWTEEIPLLGQNDNFIKDLYTLMACIWYDVSPSSTSFCQRWVTALADKPVSDVVQTFKDIDYWLITNKFMNYDGFKHHLGLTHRGYGQILSPIRSKISGFYQTGQGLPELRTAIRFITRANFPEPIGLEELAFDEWCERNLRPRADVEVRAEAARLACLFPRRRSHIQLPGFVGRFGPGASAGIGRVSLSEKYLTFGTDPMLDYVGHKVDFPPHDMPRCGTLSREGELLFVPKWLDKLRTVSIEPAPLMFYQLGATRSILSLLREGPWRRHIDLTRADLNADLAWLGSISGEYATIDLSNASDLIGYRLVKTLFKDTCLREIIVGTRSQSVIYRDRHYCPEYYAPMGSGLCFPIQCLVFASILDTVMRRNRDRRAWRVYGDDLIVPSDRYDEVVTRLMTIGFEVNLEKSFSGSSPFRESCGGDYYAGEDVRPVYVSRFWTGLPNRKSNVTTIESNIDLANRLYRYRYARLRIIKSLLALKNKPLFSYDGEYGLYSSHASNHHLPKRYNDDLQCVEYRHGVTRNTVPNSQLALEDIRYFECLRAMYENPSVQRESRTTIVRSRRGPQWDRTWGNPAPGWDDSLA